jgi:hypothetical protein
MPIDNWLCALPQLDHSHVDADLVALGDAAHPFLSDQCVCGQIEILSGHLGGRLGTPKRAVRQQVIAYSLYIRQLDVVLESGPRALCAGSCPHPPAGCYAANQFEPLILSDLMGAQHSPTALHMAHVIGLMQKLESRHNLGQDRQLRPGCCELLALDGCTLRLFKSPRCAHYLCEELGRTLVARNAEAKDFVEAMDQATQCAICAPQDYTSRAVMSAATALFSAFQVQPQTTAAIN